MRSDVAGLILRRVLELCFGIDVGNREQGALARGYARQTLRIV